MKRLVFLSLLFIAIAGYSLLSCKQKTVAPEKAIAKTLLTQVDSFVHAIDVLNVAVASDTVSEKNLQKLFLQTRIAYKKFEWAAEYFSPLVTRFVNGPPVQEIEPTDNQVFEPAGLQVIEGYLFPKYDIGRKKELLERLTTMRSRCDKYSKYFTNIELFDWQLFDAAKLEVYRIITLGITGFDAATSQKSIEEAATSLSSLQQVMAYYKGKNDTFQIERKFGTAVGYLQANTDFNSFDRAAFITGYANAMTTAITELEEKLKIHVIRYNRLLNQDAKTLFDTGAFNVNAYTLDPYYFTSDKKVALGEKLFYDPQLSGTTTRSCASCHQRDKAFTDGLVKNTAINGSASLRRNTPTLINAALQSSQFYDLRVNTLEDQAQAVIQNKEEMHGSLVVSVGRLWKDKAYREMFSAAFPRQSRAGIDTVEVMNAIGSYVRSLVRLNSRFDVYMRGDKTAMDQEEINGFNLFAGKAKCATCHYIPLFNGTFPPMHMMMDAEVIGVPASLNDTAIDGDLGRYNISHVPSMRHAFKTPTVRNAALTAPYMHNGVFTTLDQVLDFYNKGGRRGMGSKIDNQTLPFEKLDLSQKEMSEIIAFIKCLDSK